jgi:hypothetical protein
MNKKKNPIMVMVNVRMTKTQAEQLRRLAWDTNQSIAEIVRNALFDKQLISPAVEINP